MPFTLKSPWIGLGLALAVAVPLGVWAGGHLLGVSNQGPEQSDAAEATRTTAVASQADAVPTAWDAALRSGDDAWYETVVATTSPSVDWGEESDIWDDAATAGAEAWNATVSAGADAIDWTAEGGVDAWDATVDAGAAAWDWSADAIGGAAVWTGDAAVVGWEATVDALDATGEAIGGLFE